MGTIEVKQRNASQIESVKSKWKTGVTIPEEPPQLLWVVYEGEQVVGIFSYWDDASACVGALFEAQQVRMHLRAKQREDEKKNPGIGKKPGD